MGLVAEYEEREAAVFVLCSWKAWNKLPWRERAAALAHYRLHMLIDMHVYDAQDKANRATQAQGR